MQLAIEPAPSQLSEVSFYAPGKPETKGSARAFVVKGRAIITNDNKKAKQWAAVVSLAALEAMAGRSAFEGPVVVTVRFDVQRPKAHSTSKGLRPGAPLFSSSKPDVDKLARCCLDALTGVVFLDDAQVARLVVEKRYAASPGARVTVAPVGV